MTRVIIQMPLPPTLNEIIRLKGISRSFWSGGRRITISAWDEKKQEIKDAVIALVRRNVTITDENWESAWIGCKFNVHFRRDWDNVAAALKAVQDALQSGDGTGIPLLKDDRLTVIQGPVVLDYNRPIYQEWDGIEGKMIKLETFELIISDRPIYQIQMLEDPTEFHCNDIRVNEAELVQTNKRKRKQNK